MQQTRHPRSPEPSHLISPSPHVAGSKEGGTEEASEFGATCHAVNRLQGLDRSGAREPRTLTRSPRAKPETARSEWAKRRKRRRRGRKSRGGRERGRKGAFTRRASLVKVIKCSIMLRLFACLLICLFVCCVRRRGATCCAATTKCVVFALLRWNRGTGDFLLLLLIKSGELLSCAFVYVHFCCCWRKMQVRQLIITLNVWLCVFFDASLQSAQTVA